jgi:hypothetical protein
MTQTHIFSIHLLTLAVFHIIMQGTGRGLQASHCSLFTFHLNVTTSDPPKKSYFKGMAEICAVLVCSVRTSFTES